ncbi:MAG: SET domain-containing protein-lysine N-methyltransferase [Candidatus Paceibacterota bacterium]
MNKKLKVGETQKHGMGIFAMDDIRKGETLFVMGGHIIDIETENTLDEFQIDKPIEISKEFSFCPISPSDMMLMPQHYVNHSCEPNAGFKRSNFMLAIQDIPKGDEVRYDYAMIIAGNPDSKNYFSMECTCGSVLCRKIIDEEGWKDPVLQKKYRGHFQQYIEEMIDGEFSTGI